MKTVLITTTLVFGLIALFSLASHAGGKPGWGKGHDMTIAEAEKKADRMFSHVDANDDGEISPAELADMAEMRRGHRRGHPMHRGGMMGMAENGPAAMQERADAFRGEIFQALDTDGDGVLSEQEFARARAVTRSVIQKHAFARLDSNADGRLTPDEFPGFVNRLKSLDADGDGVVTRSEMRAGYAAHLEQQEQTDR